MSNPDLRPVLVKSHLSVQINQLVYEYPDQGISSYGASGLPWGRLSPVNDFGRDVYVVMNLLIQDKPRFETRATITRERTQNSERMGLRFLLDEEEKNLLNHLIATHGYYPSEYRRKYPRIPALTVLKHFPLYATARPAGHDPDWEGSLSPDDPMICKLSNLSPNGLLLTTENLQALSLIPGQTLAVTLEPRGSFFQKITFEASIRRIIEEIDSASKNTIQHFGLQISSIDQDNRNHFLQLLRLILQQIREEQLDQPD